MDHILFIHLSVVGHLGCFHFLSVMNNAAMNIHVQVFVWTYISFLSGIYIRSGIAGSCGNSKFNS